MSIEEKNNEEIRTSQKKIGKNQFKDNIIKNIKLVKDW